MLTQPLNFRERFSLLKMYSLVKPWRLAAEPLEKAIDPPRSIEPLGNEMVAGVYVDLPQG
jgi:hypothetical protein